VPKHHWDPVLHTGTIVRHGDASHLEELLPFEPTEEP
jgi:hypothetical protein